jgi:hypothetical protein
LTCGARCKAHLKFIFKKRILIIMSMVLSDEMTDLAALFLFEMAAFIQGLEVNDLYRPFCMWAL